MKSGGGASMLRTISLTILIVTRNRAEVLYSLKRGEKGERKKRDFPLVRSEGVWVKGLNLTVRQGRLQITRGVGARKLGGPKVHSP